MQIVYHADNLFDAHLVKHVLEECAIPVFLFGESLLGAAGELPLFGMLRVGVPDPYVPEALVQLKEAGWTCQETTTERQTKTAAENGLDSPGFSY